jgi:hypothetical protein
MLLILSIFSLVRPINCPVYRLYLCSYRIERFLLVKIVGNRQVFYGSGRILFCDFYRFEMPVFLIKYRKILAITYGSVNFPYLDTEVVELLKF